MALHCHIYDLDYYYYNCWRPTAVLICVAQCRYHQQDPDLDLITTHHDFNCADVK